MTKWIKTIIGVTLMIGIAGSADAFDLGQGRVLGFHSDASNGCPDLDWHLVVGANQQLRGFMAWDDMRDVVRVSGSANQDGWFHLAFQPMNGSPGSAGSVEGQFPDYNGWLSAHVVGAGCAQQDVKVPWFRSPGAGSPNG